MLEEDDGSGWINVVDNQGRKGLVPTSYVELSSAKMPTPSPVHFRSGQGSQQYGMHLTFSVGRNGCFTKYTVRGLYTYQAQGSDELSITEGELIELSGGPNGGQNYGEGWWEGNMSFCLFLQKSNDLWI